MPASPKEVIYVDVDDEITAIIEKLQATSGKIVALVLPKRAAVFQSVVNMKLLKRTADTSKKSLVLITSEKSLMPLAGAVGLHVANTLQSKPVVPSAPIMGTDNPVSVDEIEVGEAEAASPLQRNPGTTGVLKPVDKEDTIVIDDEPAPNSKGKKAAAGVAGAAGIKKFNKRLKVPDFNKFRVKLIAGAATLVLLIILFVLANSVLPTATVVISTNNAEIPTSLTVNSSPGIKEVDAESAEVPGAMKEYKKSEVQKVAATGQKDMGTKADGSVTLSLSNCSKEQVTVPAGTTLSSNNLNFVTQSAVTMQSVKIGPSCRNDDFKSVSTAKVSVTAEKAGEQYNIAAGKYVVSGFSNVSGSGESMSGGTSKVVKVVSQKDIDNLKDKVVEAASSSAKEETKKLLEAENYFAITDTFSAKDPVVTSNPGVDAEAEEVTVSVNLSFTMIGASRSGLDDVLKHKLEKKINKDQQKILDNGLGNAGIRVLNKQTNGDATFELDVKAITGVEQNVDDIREAVKGMKKNEAESVLRSREGVIDVSVKYSPFWVSKVPNNPEKIKVEFDNKSPESSDE